jgi:hypothetical protein
MQPTTSRDYQKAALQRLTTAEALLDLRLNLDAQYLGGYTVECSLKALILERTPAADQADTLKKNFVRCEDVRPAVVVLNHLSRPAEVPGRPPLRRHQATGGCAKKAPALSTLRPP